jgi:hypothetical protein
MVDFETFQSRFEIFQKGLVNFQNRFEGFLRIQENLYGDRDIFTVSEKMFSIIKIISFLVLIIIGVSQKHFAEAEMIFLASEKSFSVTQMVLGKAPIAFSLY